MPSVKGVDLLFQTGAEAIEQIEDKAFESCIMKAALNHNFGAVHALLNDYGLVLEMRERKEKNNA